MNKKHDIPEGIYQIKDIGTDSDVIYVYKTLATNIKNNLNKHLYFLSWEVEKMPEDKNLHEGFLFLRKLEKQ